MNLRRAVFALLLPCAGQVSAQGITLATPIGCDLSADCHIQQYVDRDPGPGATDFHCASLSYDGHKGTDFALPDRSAIARGVQVLAAAPGIVTGVRDGMADTGFSAATAAAINGKECGNGVVIDHGNGWETQYCHMKQGSIAVARDQRIEVGAMLGHVGQSGRAEFPHLHLSVRKDGAVVDPFDPDGTLTCDAPGDSTLWQNPPPYRPGGILAVGFSDRVPEYAAIKAGAAHQPEIRTTAPALVIYGYLFGTRQGDILKLTLAGPEGIVIEQDLMLERTQAQSFRAIGRKRRGNPWADGLYQGHATLIRNGTRIEVQTTSAMLR